MLCDICHENVATVHLTEIVGEKIIETHICENCSDLKTKGVKEHLSLFEFLDGLLPEESEKDGAVKCPGCSLSYEDFKKTNRVGCADCYKTFKRKLSPLIKKVHGLVFHKGKVPLYGKKHPHGALLKELEGKLIAAVKSEEYEEAARLRDEIKKITEGSNAGH